MMEIEVVARWRTSERFWLMPPSLSPALTDVSSVYASPMVCWLAVLGSLVVMYGAGWLLVPQSLVDSPRLLRLGLILVSGLAFVSTVTATISCGRLMFLTLVPGVQLALAGWAWRKPVPVPQQDDSWSIREVLLLAVILFLGSWVLQINYRLWSSSDHLRLLNPDLGYYAQLVQSLPESKAANSWSAALGQHAVAASGVKDQWYHWGAIYLAVAIRSVSGLPALHAMIDVGNVLLTIILSILAGAITGQICPRRSVAFQLLIGFGSLVAVQWLRTTTTMSWLLEASPEGYIAHMRYPLLMAFSYKYEGALALAALAAWLAGRRSVAAAMLFFAAMSAPHVVASVGVAAGPLMVLGVVLRKKAMWQTGGAIVALLIAAWAMTSLLGASFPKGDGQAIVAFDLVKAGKGLAIDLMLTLIFGLLLLPGHLHLIRSKDDELRPEIRLLGWLAVLAGIGASVGLQVLRNNPDCFHVMTLAQALIVMPVGLWGLVRMAIMGSLRVRVISGALAAMTVAMGLQTVLNPFAPDPDSIWSRGELATLQKALHGQPFGYMTDKDRGWWISKHALLASTLGARSVRINPLDSDRGRTSFYGNKAPFQLVPALPDESLPQWCLRFMAKLGIRHLIETRADPLPQGLKDICRKVASIEGIDLYELSAAPVAIPQRP